MSHKHRSQDKGPFLQLESIIEKAGIKLKKDNTLPCGAETPKKPAPLEKTDSDDDAFQREMRDVKRISWRHAPLEAEPTQCKVASNQDRLEKEMMKAALAGEPALAITEHPEYIEGWIGVDGKRYLPQLRSGLYSIQACLDLHGLITVEARQEVEEFITRESRFRPCCVKIIHGRGLNSASDRAVLKENLQRWLCSRRMSRRVIAYSSAPLPDGGVGATYVLLRSAKG